MERLDVLIVGAGPAGLTAGLYASRSGLSVVMYEKGLPGGLAAMADRIDNYPGFPEGISGMELGERMHAQAKRFGARTVTGTIDRLWREGDSILATAGKERISARSAIVATGLTPKKLGVPGEDSLWGKGVSYCATCDGPLYRDKVAAVIGGGDSALQEVLFLARFVSKAVLIHRRMEFRGAKVLQEAVMANAKIALALNKRIKKIEGDDKVTGVAVEDKESGDEDLIPADAVFIYVGHYANVEILGEEFNRGEEGFLATGPDLQTSVPGVFAAGDVRERALKQVVAAAAEGARAAMSVYAYLESLDKRA